jgi:nitric oxide reductase NorD protein
MGFELDEIIYKKVLKYFKNKRLNDVELLSRQINLSDIKPRLTLFARAISGAPIEIFPAEREGGYKNKSFFLPISSTLFPTKQENLKFYFFRIVYLSVQKQLNLNWDNQEQFTSTFIRKSS